MQFLSDPLPSDITSLKSIADGLSHEFNNIMHFIAVRDATLVYQAAKGFGTDDALLINVLCNRTKDQIAAIDMAYRQLPLNTSRKTLRDLVKSETSGNYGNFLQYLTQSRGSFLAEQLRKAMDGIGCNKTIVNEIFCSTTTEDIIAMRKAFEAETDRNLTDNLRSELGGEHEKLILFLLERGRPDEPVNQAQSFQQAQALQQKFKNGSTMMGGLKDAAEEEISKYLAAMPSAQCQAVARAWARLFPSDDSLEKTIVKKFGGALEEACLLLISEPRDIECKKLHDAMEGIGCDDKTLSRILGGAHKHTAVLIANRYMEKYDKNLRVQIRDETGGNFETALLTWLMGTDPTGSMEPTIQYYTKLYRTMTDPKDVVIYIKLLRQAIANTKNFIASLDADLLKLATRGIGTDERMVVSILCARTKSQLDAIDLIYRERYHVTLREYIEGELSGDLEEFLVYTQMSEAEFDAHVLRKAFTGIGCDKDAIVEVICTRSARRLQEARAYYEAHYDENLLDRIRDELGSSLEHLTLRMFAGSRGQADAPPFYANDVATQLHNEGPNTWFTDPHTFIDVLTNHTLLQMRQVCEAYERLFNASLESCIVSEFSGPLEKALVSLLHDPIDLYCRQLKEATDGLGTVESVISRVLGGNDKATVHLIAQRYYEKYNVNLVHLLSDELFYDYRNACITYVQTSDITGGLEEKLTSLAVEAHDPPPPPAAPKRAPPPPPPKSKNSEARMNAGEAAGAAALGAGLVVGFAAATLVAGPVGFIIFGVVAANVLLGDEKN